MFVNMTPIAYRQNPAFMPRFWCCAIAVAFASLTQSEAAEINLRSGEISLEGVENAGVVRRVALPSIVGAPLIVLMENGCRIFPVEYSSRQWKLTPTHLATSKHHS